MGSDAARACDCADRLAAGSIHISAETCRKLGPSANWPPDAAELVAPQRQDGRSPAAITLALTPRPAAMSPFAEFGLA